MSGPTTVDEQMKMKVLLDTGHTKTEICEVTGRGYKAVTRGLKTFESLLVCNDDLYEKFSEEKEKYVERMVQNSAALIMASDQQTANVLHEATAIEAAKISQIHAQRLNGLANLSGGSLDGEDGKSAKVVNFINQVFNIVQKNDRPETIPGTQSGVGSDVLGRQEASDAGIV